ncbi:hypothetical protein ACPVTF_10975 [Geobacillus icigianus]|uniref:hypothetical protein n=1 Tax=Geobacillus TaxID=129337 RepID=UPI00129028AD|nr:MULTISPECIES: hypothetical protein [Geobacillus]
MKNRAPSFFRLVSLEQMHNPQKRRDTHQVAIGVSLTIAGFLLTLRPILKGKGKTPFRSARGARQERKTDLIESGAADFFLPTALLKHRRIQQQKNE